MQVKIEVGLRVGKEVEFAKWKGKCICWSSRSEFAQAFRRAVQSEEIRHQFGGCRGEAHSARSDTATLGHGIHYAC